MLCSTSNTRDHNAGVKPDCVLMCTVRRFTCLTGTACLNAKLKAHAHAFFCFLALPEPNEATMRRCCRFVDTTAYTLYRSLVVLSPYRIHLPDQQRLRSTRSAGGDIQLLTVLPPTNSFQFIAGTRHKEAAPLHGCADAVTSILDTLNRSGSWQA
jgi:hypothetical protein